MTGHGSIPVFLLQQDGVLCAEDECMIGPFRSGGLAHARFSDETVTVASFAIAYRCCSSPAPECG